MPWRSALARVANRGSAPPGFLDEIVAALRALPDEVFAERPGVDIYSVVYHALGPYTGIPHRRAVMAEVLRVLAGFESSWKWTCGRDDNNPASSTETTEEAGAFQVSFDSRGFGADLRAIGPSEPVAWRAAMKSDHRFAVEYAARLLRHTTRHNGPVARGEILAWLSCQAVEEFGEAMG